MRPKKEKVCVICKNLFLPKSGSMIYCCEECKKIGLKIIQQKQNDKRKISKNKASGKKNVLTINEVLALGRKHGIYGYGKIVLAIERGEIEV